jgi:hypothetical protein
VPTVAHLALDAAGAVPTGRASRGQRCRSARAGVLPDRLPSPRFACGAGGMAGAQPEVSARGRVIFAAKPGCSAILAVVVCRGRSVRGGTDERRRSGPARVNVRAGFRKFRRIAV